MRIRIIGCSVSGKTYLAKRLSEKYNIPSFDLDDIQWDNSQSSYGVKMPLEKRNQMLNDIFFTTRLDYRWCLLFLGTKKF